MSNEPKSRPDFIGEEWLTPSRGFTYEARSSAEVLDWVELSSEWGRLVFSLERLKVGYFEEDRSLLQLVLSSEDRDIRSSGLRILGHAASRDCRWALRTLFISHSEETRLAAYDAALYSADLRFIEPLLVACRIAHRNERLTIMSRLSHMLEFEPGDLYDDLGELSHDEYEERVVSVRDALLERYGDDVAIFEGSPLSVARIISRIETLCDSAEAYDYSGTISMYFDLLEAMTGKATVGIFDDEVAVNAYAAIRCIAELQRSWDLAVFEAGKRYFFGHPLPS